MDLNLPPKRDSFDDPGSLGWVRSDRTVWCRFIVDAGRRLTKLDTAVRIPASRLAVERGNCSGLLDGKSWCVGASLFPGRKETDRLDMGCEIGKLATPNQPTTDPRLPLTAKQKFTVMASWKAVSRKLETTGVFMLMRQGPHPKEEKTPSTQSLGAEGTPPSRLGSPKGQGSSGCAKLPHVAWPRPMIHLAHRP
ncbi:hypothetical protein WN48_09891 [Eufriesea mexicana]|nr:hypothetical protein WN48_09891 [Eufriesea mexicana]